MKTKTLVTGVALATLIGVTAVVPAMAHGISNDSCDVNLNYDISLEPQKLVLSQKGMSFIASNPANCMWKAKKLP